MNIAHLLPHSAVFPLKKHNGRYEWALRLARLQAAKGHTVTIYAGAGSGSDSMDESSIVWRSTPSTGHDKQEENLTLIKSAFAHTEHDIFHSHFDYLHYFVADLTDKPVIATQHWYPSQAIADAVPFNKKRNVLTVPVTDTMKQEDARLGIPATDRIYHGIDLSLFHPTPEHSNRLLFVGRIHPSKGTSEAIHYAIAAGVPLDIIGKVNATEREYWDTLQPLVDGQHIRYLGPQPQAEVAKAFAHAKGFIFPGKSTEAFGQVTIEAQACGTPVIINDGGASRELIKQNKTGFICTTETEFVSAIQRLDTIDRDMCRQNAERFDLTTMVSAYEALYCAAPSLISN